VRRIPQRTFEADTGAVGSVAGDDRPSCLCFARPGSKFSEVEFHQEQQDTGCDAWRRLLGLIEEAAADKRPTFAPLAGIDAAQRKSIVTLPPTIAKLTSVTHLDLYGSHLVSIPSEIGQMRNLTDFDPYTSYRLHWFPYEIVRCRRLRRSKVSTRALYGNHKLRPPFPRLEPYEPTTTRTCSVCDRVYDDAGRHRVWVSLMIATDVLPLLVNACSRECIQRLPRPAAGYVQRPHRGGKGFVEQPPPRI
jgi:hypothetical protein